MESRPLLHLAASIQYAHRVGSAFDGHHLILDPLSLFRTGIPLSETMRWSCWSRLSGMKGRGAQIEWALLLLGA